MPSCLWKFGTLWLVVLLLVACSSTNVVEGARKNRPKTTYFNMKTSRRTVYMPELHIPKLFRSNSGATKPIKKSQIAKAKGVLPKYQFVQSTFSPAIEGKRRFIPRAYDKHLEEELRRKERARREREARLRKNAMSTIIVERSKRNRKQRASMKDQRECKGSKHMWKPERVAPAPVLEEARVRVEEEEEEREGSFNASRRLQQQGRSSRLQNLVFHPLDQFCETEKSINVTGPLDRGEELLVQCLKAGKKCGGFTGAEFDLIEKTLSKFDGIYFLRHEKPRCMAMNLKTCPTGFGNLETGVERLTRRDRDMITRASGLERFELRDRKDIFPGKRFKTCAIVGNAPSLGADKFGEQIDKYDAVFRFNHVQGTNPEKKFPKRSGHKTTIRLFSKLPSFGLATGRLKVKPTSKDELWLFWHDVSRHYIPGAERNHKDAPIRMTSPFLINWQVKVYFALRREMVRLGLGPFQCPHNINSGLHAVLMAQLMCNKIGVFGLSYDEKHAVGGGHFGNRDHRMSKKHDWGFDTLVLRILHLSKQSGLCT
ncbi:hypothetical protein HOP50_19g83900 [Chloropicon primus]|uniref:Sialyltransferase n=1 Tax=Chloropicon primus TaxID=1764295 RepID=A0A5B8MYH0_9CHLO|nr:hypothetical protein A3770_19p83660 [Chloropicon primus]UPR05043.1 hypothetical protein HOP50_19g83900 [Chloropicon primus]|eukprot:QDZ25848.1 hypothetical protein A3770_19p83660 [Chloropicon primus]